MHIDRIRRNTASCMYSLTSRVGTRLDVRECPVSVRAVGEAVKSSKMVEHPGQLALGGPAKCRQANSELMQLGWTPPFFMSPSSFHRALLFSSPHSLNPIANSNLIQTNPHHILQNDFRTDVCSFPDCSVECESRVVD